MAVSTDFLPANYAQKWNWRVFMSGYEAARFMTADRPKATFEVMEFNPGGTHRPVKQPGRLSFDDLSFERGEIVDSESDFVTWMEQCLTFTEGQADSAVAQELFRDIDIEEYGNDNSLLNSWTLHGAFISGFDGNDLDGSSSDTKTESITVTYQYFTRRKI